MKELALRLKKGDELKEVIQNLNIETGVILSSVGSLSYADIRLAKALDHLKLKEDLELISLNGTISLNDMHLHLCVSDQKGRCYGGHLKKAIVNTTVELVIGVLEEYTSCRREDQTTGYKEIEFVRK